MYGSSPASPRRKRGPPFSPPTAKLLHRYDAASDLIMWETPPMWEGPWCRDLRPLAFPSRTIAVLRPLSSLLPADLLRVAMKGKHTASTIPDSHFDISVPRRSADIHLQNRPPNLLRVGL